MRRTKRSVWHDRDVTALASKRGRPRSCPQWLWFWATPERTDPTGRDRANGWSGGRDRDKPRKESYRLCVRGRCAGGVQRYEHNGRWAAYLIEGGILTAGTNAHFAHRRDAKRWVEARSGEEMR